MSNKHGKALVAVCIDTTPTGKYIVKVVRADGVKFAHALRTNRTAAMVVAGELSCKFSLPLVGGVPA